MKRIYFLLLSCLPLMTAGQNVPDTTGKVIQLNEFVISANKWEEKKSDIPQTIEIIKSRDVEFNNPQTSADMLQQSGNVFVQKSQMGGGSPVLRGFEANRVLLVADGVRMNNAISRSGHLQDALAIDNMILERTEVLFGPSSVMYGSDALGGVMHFYTKNPALSDSANPLYKINIGLRHSTANNEVTAHADFNLGYKKIALLTGITSSIFGDLRTGSVRPPFAKSFGKCNYFVVQDTAGADTLIRNSFPNIQHFTGYTQLNLFEKILFRQSNSVSHLLNFQYSNTSEVPRYDRLQQFGSNGEPVYARWHYAPQQRIFLSLKTAVGMEKDSLAADTSAKNKRSAMNITLAYQNILQGRVTRRFKQPDEKRQLEEVNLFSLNLEIRKEVGKKNELHYGAEVAYNDVQSSAKTKNIFTQEESAAATRYPDGGNTMLAAAVYFSHSWEISEKYILTDGLRFNYVELKSEWKNISLFPFTFSPAEQKNNAVNGSIGFVAMPGCGWRFTLQGASGFRAPNVDDMGKTNESAAGILIIPNPDLKPELAYSGDAGISKTFGEKVRIEGVYFYTLLQNAMVVKDAKFYGADSVLFDGAMSKVQSLQNADEGWIQGGSASFLADISENVALKSSLGYTFGRYKDSEKDTLVPMDHIPPLFGQTGLLFRYKNTLSEFYVQYNGWKRLEDYSPSGEDNLAQATVYGMPAWFTLNIKTSFPMNEFLRLIVGVENILDTHYRTFASGISAPGRNFIVALRGKI